MGGTSSIDWYDDGTTTTAEPPPAAAPHPRAFRWPRPLALVAITLVFLTICGMSWWLTNPATFEGGSYGTLTPVGFGPLATDIGDLPATNDGTRYVPVVVSIEGVTPVLAAEDRSRVDVTYVVCRPAPETNRIMTARPADLQRWCAEVRPFTPGSSIEVPTWQVLAVLTPRDDQPLTVHGYVVTYRDGIRAGRQLMGPQVDLNSAEAGSPALTES
jgi:hypothetical protein